jgi:hypothetical protein
MIPPPRPRTDCRNVPDLLQDIKAASHEALKARERRKAAFPVN